MSQETKNTEKIKATSAELSEHELDQVAGGTVSAKPTVSEIPITKGTDRSTP